MTETIEQQWSACLMALQIEPSSILQDKKYQRVYATDTHVIKIKLRDAEKNPGNYGYGDLWHEFDILRHCAGITGVPTAVRFDHCERGHCAVYERIHGTALAQRGSPLPRVQGLPYWRAMVQVAWILFRLSLRGIQHGDLHNNNILVDQNNRAYLIDFDRARKRSRTMAFLHNFCRVRSPGDGIGVPFLYLIGWGIAPYVPARLGMSVARAFGYRPTLWPTARNSSEPTHGCNSSDR